jgi:hypothetical protein
MEPLISEKVYGEENNIYVPYSFLFISNKFYKGGEWPKQGD